jgi:hypothetical protein
MAAFLSLWLGQICCHVTPAQLSVNWLQVSGESRVSEVRINVMLTFEQVFWNRR